MTHKKGRAMKEALEWFSDPKRDAPMEVDGTMSGVHALIDWHHKKFGFSILDSLKILAAYSPRRIEELDAQRQIETEG